MTVCVCVLVDWWVDGWVGLRGAANKRLIVLAAFS